MVSMINAEGLTWSEWFMAATQGCKHKPTNEQRSHMRLEWKNGVDPTEWAAYFEKQKPEVSQVTWKKLARAKHVGR
jgi:hypothetical protein